MSSSICTLEEITDASAGGKAYGLARLVAMGGEGAKPDQQQDEQDVGECTHQHDSF